MTAPARATSPEPDTKTLATPAPERTRSPRPPRSLREGGTARERTSGATALKAKPSAAERAYARKAGRRDRWLKVVPERRLLSGRAPFVLVVMALLACGLVATLWLTTAATMGSYELERDRKASRDLTEQVEQLKVQVAEVDSTSMLERRAQQLGLVPAGNPAHLVPKPDGSVDVIGDPAPAKAPATPDPQPAQQPPAQQQTPPPSTGGG